MREYIVERLKGHYRFGVVPVVGQVFNLSGQDEILSYGTVRHVMMGRSLVVSLVTAVINC